MKQHLRRIRNLVTFNNCVLLVALLIAGSWIWSTVEAIGKNFRLQQQVDALAQEVAVSELQNKTLQLQNNYYSSDQFLELSAREHLNLVSPGEKVLILPQNKVQPLAQTFTAQDSGGQKSNFEQWMNFLLGSKN